MLKEIAIAIACAACAPVHDDLTEKEIIKARMSLSRPVYRVKGIKDIIKSGCMNDFARAYNGKNWVNEDCRVKFEGLVEEVKS